MVNNKSRFSFVDALRGIAALSVVLFHANAGKHITELFEAMPSWLQLILSHSNGVAVFFTLSGFVIAHSLRDRRMTLAAVGRFMLRRSVRLDPPYWVAIVLTIGFSALATVVIKDRPPNQYSLAQIAAHIFYVQDILGFGNVNDVFWTLCIEIQFYLVFALLLMAPRSVFPFVFAVSLLWPLGIISAQHLTGWFLPLWYGFLLGVLAYWTWRDNSLAPLFAGYALIIGVAAGFTSDVFALICVLTAIALLLAGVSGQISNLLSWKWLQFLGTVSYSLYLIHNPITGATFRAGYMLTARTLTTEALWWAISLIACIATAAVVYLLVERPSLAIARKIDIGVQPTRNTVISGQAATN